MTKTKTKRDETKRRIERPSFDLPFDLPPPTQPRTLQLQHPTPTKPDMTPTRVESEERLQEGEEEGVRRVESNEEGLLDVDL